MTGCRDMDKKHPKWPQKVFAKLFQYQTAEENQNRLKRHKKRKRCIKKKIGKQV